MNFLLITPLVLAACQTPVATTVASAPDVVTSVAITSGQQGEAQVRVYDLTPLALRSTDVRISDLVFPALSPWNDEEFEELQCEADDEVPAALLRMLFAREFEYEGNEIEYLGEGRFAVTGPAGLHERIGRALPRLAAVLNATIDLELAVVRLDRPASSGEAVVPEAQALALLEQADPARVSRWRFSLSSARPETLVQGRWVDVLADYDCEVAQGSYVYDPHVMKAYLGTRVALRAAPGAGGTYLALTLRRTTGVGTPTDRRLTRTARMSNERDMRVDEIELVHERLPILDRALALNTFLADGQALVLSASQGRVGSHELLVVRRVGGGLARAVELKAGESGGGLLLLDSGGWAPPCAESSWEGFGSWRAPLDPLRNGQSLYVTLTGPRERGLPVGDLVYQFPTLVGGEPRDTEIFEPWVALLPSEGGALPDVEKALGGLAPEQKLVRVTLSLRSPAVDAPVSSLTLPLRAGLQSAALLGVEDTYVPDADVEVAQDSSIEDPILGSLFDGLALELLPRFDLDGSLVLRLNGLASASDGDPRKVDAGDGAVGEIEVASQRFLVISQELRFPAGGGAPRATIGDLAGGLSLEVEARF